MDYDPYHAKELDRMHREALAREAESNKEFWRVSEERDQLRAALSRFFGYSRMGTTHADPKFAEWRVPQWQMDELAAAMKVTK
jgi:hypothetical protein